MISGSDVTRTKSSAQQQKHDNRDSGEVQRRINLPIRTHPKSVKIWFGNGDVSCGNAKGNEAAKIAERVRQSRLLGRACIEIVFLGQDRVLGKPTGVFASSETGEQSFFRNGQECQASLSRGTLIVCGSGLRRSWLRGGRVLYSTTAYGVRRLSSDLKDCSVPPPGVLAFLGPGRCRCPGFDE